MTNYDNPVEYTNWYSQQTICSVLTYKCTTYLHENSNLQYLKFDFGTDIITDVKMARC